MDFAYLNGYPSSKIVWVNLKVLVSLIKISSRAESQLNFSFALLPIEFNNAKQRYQTISTVLYTERSSYNPTVDPEFNFVFINLFNKILSLLHLSGSIFRSRPQALRLFQAVAKILQKLFNSIFSHHAFERNDLYP